MIMMVRGWCRGATQARRSRYTMGRHHNRWADAEQRTLADGLAGRICAAAAEAARSSYVLLELLGEFDATHAIRYWTGFKSLAHWLSWSCSMNPGGGAGTRSGGQGVASDADHCWIVRGGSVLLLAAINTARDQLGRHHLNPTRAVRPNRSLRRVWACTAVLMRCWMWPAAFFRLRRRIVRVRIALWWSSVDARLHRVRDPTIPAVLSPTNQAGQLSPTWPSRLGSVH
jgi:hypothetical protein